MQRDAVHRVGVDSIRLDGPELSILSLHPLQCLSVAETRRQHWRCPLMHRKGVKGIVTVPPETEGMAEFVQGRGLQNFGSQFW